MKMNSSMKKGIIALKGAVESIEHEISQLCQHLPIAESIMTGSDNGTICSLPGEINSLLYQIDDHDVTKKELSQRKVENDQILNSFIQEVCDLYGSLIDNINS